MEEKLKIEGHIYSVEEGQIKLLRFGNSLFKYAGEVQEQPKEVQHKELDAFFVSTQTKPTISMPIKKKYLKGKKVGSMRNNVIYENILNDMKEGLGQYLEYKQLEEIVKPYYPGTNESSLHTYVNVYKRYINSGEQSIKPKKYKQKQKPRKRTPFIATEKHPFDKGKKLGQISNLRIYENIQNDIIESKGTLDDAISIVKKYYPNFKSSSARSYGQTYVDVISGKRTMSKRRQVRSKSFRAGKRRRRPKGTVGRSKSYNVNILCEDVEKVKTALNHVEYNYKPTLPILLKRTQLNHNRLMGTLDILRRKGEIDSVRNHGERIYYKLK